MSIEIGNLYDISSKTAKPGNNKYFIVATEWNSEILEHLKQNSNPPENSAFGDWILTDNPNTYSLKELPITLKKQFGIVNIHNPNGGYSRKRKLKKRSTTRRRRSSKRQSRKMNKRRR